MTSKHHTAVSEDGLSILASFRFENVYIVKGFLRSQKC